MNVAAVCLQVVHCREGAVSLFARFDQTHLLAPSGRVGAPARRRSDRLAVLYADGVPRPVRMVDELHLVPFGASALRFSPRRVFDRTSFPSGGTGLVGTASDVLKLLEAVRAGGGPILSGARVKAMTMSAIGDLRVHGVEEGGATAWASPC